MTTIHYQLSFPLTGSTSTVELKAQSNQGNHHCCRQEAERNNSEAQDIIR